MAKIKSIVGMLVTITLVLSISIPLVPQLVAADDGEGGMESKVEPKEEVYLEKKSLYPFLRRAPPII